MIHIKTLNKQLLYEYIHSQEYNNLQNIPISKHRALSHINNPAASNNDVLLLLAYEEEQLVGYLGVLADNIMYQGKSEKVGWFSCLWIDNRHRGKQIAFKLVQKCFDVWNDRLMVTEFTGPAKKLYDKTGKFKLLKENKGIRLYNRFNLHHILPRKKKSFENFKPLLKITDNVLNTVFDIRFLFNKNLLKDIKIEYINYIDEQLDIFIKKHQKEQLFRRGADELNWLLKNPWILSSPDKDKESRKYYFSSLDKLFEFTAIKVFNKKNELISFVIFARRNDELKIPYCYGDIDAVVKVINYHFIKWKIKTFITFNANLASKLKKSNPFSLFKKEAVRGYIISTFFDIDTIDKDFIIQDGDADCSFT